MGGVERIELSWIGHPDAALANRPEVLIPDVSIALAGMKSRAPALFVPAATCVILPRRVAYAIEGIRPDEADEVAPDPLLFHLSAHRPLRQLRGRHRVRVFGAAPADALEVRLPITWATSDQLAAVIRGAPFFQAVVCHLDPLGASYLEVLAPAG